MAGRRRALIVANDVYEHEGLRHLRAPAADATALAGVLGDPRIGDFAVQVSRNEPAHVVQGQVEEFFAEARPEDVLVLHFSCHGLKSDSGELFFAARNTRPNRLASSAVSADFVQRCMRASRSQSIVLLLDCCYGGAFSRGVAVRASGSVNVLDSFPGGRGGGRGRAVITASNSMEYAFEGDELADDRSARPSVFTTALVDGLASGEADRDEDGWVSLNELYDYVFDRVREQTPHQTPSRDIEMQGELFMARSRRRRIQPLPIPADLRAATTDPNVFTRLGAVSELRSRLRSDNLPAAAGAQAVLEEMARTDIGYVADAADAALREAALHAGVSALDFGLVEWGSSPAPRVVPLLGPPLARAGTVDVSAPWLTAEETAEGLAVSVDASRVGALRGEITVSGPLGEVVVPVSGEVVEPAPEPVAPAAPQPPEAAAAEPVAPPVTVPVAAAAAPAAAPTPAGAPPTAPPDRRLPVAAGLAIASGALLLLSLVLPYQWDTTPIEKGDPYPYPIIFGLLAIAAGVATLTGRPRPLVGPGLLLGAVAGSLSGLTFDARQLGDDGLGSGWGAGLTAHLLLLVAAVLAARTLRATRGVRVARRRPDGAGWALLAVGGAGAVALVLHTRMLLESQFAYWGDWTVLPAVTLTVMALLVPAVAAMTGPRRFSAALLAGWVAGAAGVFASYYFGLADYGVKGPLAVFGVTLLALAGLAVLLARTPPPDAGAGSGPMSAETAPATGETAQG